jgi:hypothetical protein
MLERISYFRRLGKPMKLTTIIFVGLRDRRNKLYLFRRLCWPTKRNVFSSVADENAFIFVNFIPSAYFRRPADEYMYFR